MSRECGVYQQSVSNSKMQSLETLWGRTCLLEYQTVYYTHLQWVSHNMHGLCSSYVLVPLTTTCQVTIQILLPKIYFGTLNTLGGGFRVPLQSATWWNPFFKDNKMKLFFFFFFKSTHVTLFVNVQIWIWTSLSSVVTSFNSRAPSGQGQNRARVRGRMAFLPGVMLGAASTSPLPHAIYQWQGSASGLMLQSSQLPERRKLDLFVLLICF